MAEWKQYEHVSFEQQQLLCTGVKAKRERWFWIKRIAYILGLRDKPVHWEVTFEFQYLP